MVNRLDLQLSCYKSCALALRILFILLLTGDNPLQWVVCYATLVAEHFLLNFNIYTFHENCILRFFHTFFVSAHQITGFIKAAGFHCRL